MSDPAEHGHDKTSCAFVDVGALEDFEIGTARRVVVAGAQIAVFRAAEGALHGLTDCCPHAGAPLSEGALRDGVVVCAWHGWRFDPATGRCANVTWSAPVAAHDVRVIDGRVQVATTRRP